MQRIKVLTLVGTRPEAIKMAPVIRQLERRAPLVISRVCATGQHREMLDQVLQVFQIVPDHDLALMRPGQTLAQLSANLLSQLDGLLERERPDWVLVQGDTTTVMVASLVAYYHRIRIGHVEAGLRTGDKWQPYPEEMNRRITDVLADLYFAPTTASRQNLLREGIPDNQIVVTGNTIVDALQITVDQLRHDTRPALIDGADKRRLVLVTAHRRENFGEPLAQICRALIELAERYRSEIQIVYPVHRNPNVQGPVHQLLGGIPNISLIEPLDYYEFVRLMSHAYLILTDSGGLQEEAPSLRKPVLVLREVTERPEGVAAGVVKVVGCRKQSIVDAVVKLMEDETSYQQMARGANPYGDGHASERIVAAICGISPLAGAPAALDHASADVETAQL